MRDAEDVGVGDGFCAKAGAEMSRMTPPTPVALPP
jgi:hypothetical protein